ncbi:hypothetical protein OEZ85_007941 [Tetradesmus obliquus]|uniref:FAS1 domain-containing protein n=1 Tax=Tetradesmus obliquus TaxID=3088 RepID=A0ABY8TJB2_TETOB|nr:hypothetical protein OEZ85_007941 [Tetradesmus obliquus]
MRLIYNRRARPWVPLCVLVLLLSGALSVSARVIELSDPGQAITMEMLSGPAAAGTLRDRRTSNSKPPGLAGDEVPPDTYAVQGIIDPLSQHNSEEPGVLVPLAQAASSIDHWMEAVDAAGAATPLSDPSFEGTVFIPNDAAFEAAYPTLRQAAAPLQRQSSSISDVLSGLKQAQLAAQLNSLTVPGLALKLEQLAPGAVLTTAEGGSLKVLGVWPDDGTARLQHLPTGAIISIIEPDLQSGQAVAHVVDSLLSPDQAASVAAEQGSAAGGPGGRYASAMAVLQDPAQQLLGFAGLVQQAGMAAELSEDAAALTLFVPSNEALRSFLDRLSPAAQRALLSNASLADAVVSGHMVSGVALGSKALLALAEGQMVRTQAASLLHVQRLRGGAGSHPSAASAPHAAVDSSSSRLVAEQGQQQQQAPPASAAALLAVDGAVITTSDLIGGKAVVHVIDKVLIPPETAAELGTVPTSNGPGSLRAPATAASAAARPVCSAAVQLAGIAAAAVALGAWVP